MVVAKLDRLARSTQDTLNTLATLADQGLVSSREEVRGVPQYGSRRASHSQKGPAPPEGAEAETAPLGAVEPMATER